MSVREQEPILSIRGVSKKYPGTIALAGVDLDVYPGEVIALLGENGAGKSTLAKIIAGVEQPSEGTMTWFGRDYAPKSPLEARQAGIGMIHQEMQLLPDLTVVENVFVGRWIRNSRGNVTMRVMEEDARAQLAALGFTKPMNTLVRDLSVAGQQQVEIAKALLLDAKVLILDEPTAALGEEETQSLFRCVRELQKQGVAFIYVSHRLAEIAQIATRIVVLRDGNLIKTHDSADIEPDLLVAEMVGRSVERLFPDMGEPGDEPLLEVERVYAARGFVKDVSFTVHAGEVFGIAGLVGAGRTELVRALVGADETSTGSVRVAGKTIAPHSVAAARDRGLVMVPEDRKRQGVVLDFSIQENIALANFEAIRGRGGWLKDSKARTLAGEVISEMGVKGEPGKLIRQLSGGNQQKVVIGKWIARKPKVVILDEPTRGIDVGARAAIYEVIAKLRDEGIAVVVVSSDLEEVIGLSHRVMVVSRGEVKGVLPRGEATGETVIAMAV